MNMILNIAKQGIHILNSDQK